MTRAERRIIDMLAAGGRLYATLRSSQEIGCRASWLKNARLLRPTGRGSVEPFGGNRVSALVVERLIEQGLIEQVVTSSDDRQHVLTPEGRAQAAKTGSSNG